MPLLPPIVDGRRYEDIVRETLARAQVHTPEWNNHADADAGVTLVQLFAFMTESLLYRADQIPERNRLKLYVEDTLLTAYTKSHGFSTVDTSNLYKSISDVLKAFNLTNVKMTAGSVYTDKFLPPKEERIPPMWKG